MQLSFNAMGPKRVLMICLGNICRSPLAEGMLAYQARERGIELIVDSAGTSGLTGNKPDTRSCEVARVNGILLQHSARRLTRGDFKKFDHLLVMDKSNLENTLALAVSDEERAKVKLITDYDPRPLKPQIVRDPYYGDLKDFHDVYEQLVHCISGWLDHHYKP
ncbi:MAG: low molecular weight protein-tyrosine-phosphatase [Bacteriovoracaceae bacterium]